MYRHNKTNANVETNTTVANTEKVQEASTQNNNFTYNVYFELNAEWNAEFSESDIEQMVSMGLTKNDTKGQSVLAIAGQVDKAHEMITVLKQSTLLPYIGSSGTQMFVDTNDKVSYMTATNLGSTKESDWVKDEYTADALTLDYFLDNIDWVTEETDDVYVCKKGKYHLNDDNYITIILAYIESTYAVKIPEELNVTAYMNKETGLLDKIEYDMSEFVDDLIYENYKVTDTKCTITFTDINNVTLNIPEGLDGKVK